MTWHLLLFWLHVRTQMHACFGHHNFESSCNVGKRIYGKPRFCFDSLWRRHKTCCIEHKCCIYPRLWPHYTQWLGGGAHSLFISLHVTHWLRLFPMTCHPHAFATTSGDGSSHPHLFLHPFMLLNFVWNVSRHRGSKDNGVWSCLRHGLLSLSRFHYAFCYSFSQPNHKWACLA